MNKILSKEQILQLWETNERKISVYVHNPFCIQVCKYCAYKGVLKTDDIYQKYYYEYLPNQINFYKPVLENNTIRSWFFGGGTPNIMKPDTMEYILSLFPEKFKTEGEKIIEMYPSLTTKEHIDILAKYNFTTIIIGVQTFDSEVLKEQNRLPSEVEQVKWIIDYAHSKGIKIGIDLIAYLPNAKEDNVKNDLEILHSMMPEEITIATNYKERSNYLTKVINTIKSSTMLKDYRSFDLGFADKIKVARLFRNDVVKEYNRGQGTFYNFISGLEDFIVRDAEYDCSTLGIGSYKNSCKNTYSNINQEYAITEKNVDWKPEYELLYHHNFYDSARQTIDTLEKIMKGKNPPSGTTLTIQNTLNSSEEKIVENCFKDFYYYEQLPYWINFSNNGLEFHNNKVKDFKDTFNTEKENYKC